MKTREEINEIVRLLLAEYPEAVCSLDWNKDYELLFSVRLSAQCTDERVNMVTPALFERFPTLESFAEADVEDGSVGHGRRRHEKYLSDSDVEEVHLRICRAALDLVCVVVKKSELIVGYKLLHVGHLA